MQGIVGFSTLAIAALPTLAVADGDGASPARPAESSQARSSAGRWAPQLAALRAALSAEPLLDPGRGRRPTPRRRSGRDPNDDDDKQQYGRKRHKAEDKLPD